jgi:DNA-binding transcriptional MerR regulator
MDAMWISQLAERTGVSASTLRFYEKEGLLAAGRTSAGYRVYGQDAVERLAFIKTAKHLGLPLEEIADLLAAWEAGTCASEARTTPASSSCALWCCLPLPGYSRHDCPPPHRRDARAPGRNAAHRDRRRVAHAPA